MKKKLVVLLIVLTSLLSACGQPVETVPEATDPVKMEVYKLDDEEPVPTPTPKPEGAEDDPRPYFGDPKAPFELSESEKQLYDKFVETNDLLVFMDVPPVSVFKVFVQYGIDGDWQHEFGLVNKKNVILTVSDWRKANERDIANSDITTRKDQADVIYGTIDDGTLTDNGDGSAVWTFTDANDQTREALFLRDLTGVWQINIRGISAPIGEFSLTDNEKELYNKFMDNPDSKIFKDITPDSIAKVFIQFMIEGKWKQAFDMASKKNLQIDFESWEQIVAPKYDYKDYQACKDIADYAYCKIDDYYFTDNGDGTGVLKFLNTYDKEISIKFIQNSKDKVWEVDLDSFWGYYL